MGHITYSCPLRKPSSKIIRIQIPKGTRPLNMCQSQLRISCQLNVFCQIICYFCQIVRQFVSFSPLQACNYKTQSLYLYTTILFNKKNAFLLSLFLSLFHDQAVSMLTWYQRLNLWNFFFSSSSSSSRPEKSHISPSIPNSFQ